MTDEATYLSLFTAARVEKVRGVSFTVHAAEILGVAGVDGNGQTELIDAITGLRRSQSGHVRVAGEDITNVSARHALDSGIGTCGKEGQSVPVGVGQPTLLIEGLTVGGTAA